MKSKFKPDALLQMQKMEGVLKDFFFFKYHPPPLHHHLLSCQVLDSHANHFPRIE